MVLVSECIGENIGMLICIETTRFGSTLVGFVGVVVAVIFAWWLSV